MGIYDILGLEYALGGPFVGHFFWPTDCYSAAGGQVERYFWIVPAYVHALC